MIRSFHYVPFAYSERTRARSFPLGVLLVQLDECRLCERLSNGNRIQLLGIKCDDVDKLMHLASLDKAFYELRYELNNRPDWIEIPLHGLVAILEDAQHEA